MVQRVNSSNAVPTDRFGISVAVDNDFIVVGAPFEDAVGTDSGSAYIFIKNPNQP